MNETIDLVIEKYGEEVRPDVESLDKLVKEFIDTNFQTKNANIDLITKSFNRLLGIYNFTLSKEGKTNLALISYLSETFKENKDNAFNITRINMMTPVETGGNHSNNRYVADMNQLFYNLSRVATYEQLKKFVRVEDILDSVRSTKYRIAIENYLVSIDY